MFVLRVPLDNWLDWLSPALGLAHDKFHHSRNVIDFFTPIVITLTMQNSTPFIIKRLASGAFFAIHVMQNVFDIQSSRMIARLSC